MTGTQYIIDKCREHGVRLIFIGSTGAIPEQPMGTAIAGIGRLLGRMSDVAEKLTRKPQRMTSFAVYNLVRNNEFDSSKAVAELGYSPRPMAQSIAEEIDWMIEEGIVTIPAVSAHSAA